MKQIIVVFLIFLGFYKLQFGQNECADFVMSITDFHSKNIMISGTYDSLLNKMGEPMSVVSRDSFPIVDSIYNLNEKRKFHYYSIDIERIFFDGLMYTCYNDSVQLTFIDFSKINDTLIINNISFYKGLDMDNLLKECNMDTSCVTLAFDGYYLSHKRLHQVFFYSKYIVLLGFHFYFDLDTKKLWYADFDLQRGDGIIH